MSTGLYCRVSTDKGEQQHAMAQQLDRLRLAAQGQDAIEYIEVASGSRDDREQLNRLMQDCRSGKLDTVICTRLDRISRSMAHGAQLLEYFTGEDTPNLIALDDGLDLSTIGGRLVARMLINLAQAEVERLTERTSHGMAKRKAELMPFGPAPYGYRLTEDRTNLEPDPKTAPVARALVQAFIDTKLMRPALRQLELQGQPTFRSIAGFKAWLLNPTLAGYRVYKKMEVYRDEQGHRRRRHKPAGEYGELVADCHPKLISEVEHAKVRAIFANQRVRDRSGLVANRVNTLTGLVVCGHCGHRMNYQYGKALRYVYVKCVYLACEGPHSNRIRSDKVEEALWAALKEHKQQLLTFDLGKQVELQTGLEQQQALAQQIKDLEALHDPDLAEAIYRKRARLELMLHDQIEAPEMEYSAEQISQALGDERFWEVARADEATKRQFFVQHVERVVVRDQQVESVELRLPGAIAH